MNTIFLVEDNPADVELFQMALQEVGVKYDLVLFEDGAEVINYVCNPETADLQKMPDLMVLDLNLPRNDGLEILQVVRNKPAFADLPIAVLSSSSSSRERASLATFKVREFIAKPPDLEQYMNIGQIVRNLLDEIAAERATASIKRAVDQPA